MTVELMTQAIARPSQAAPAAGRTGGHQAIGLLEHEGLHGPLPLPGLRGRAQRDSASRLIDVIERSGLTGRGGAGFPTGRKLRSVAAERGRPVVVANGSEGEPASAKDRLLLSRSPHLVLDGISLAAFAVGADRAFLVVHRRERPAGREPRSGRGRARGRRASTRSRSRSSASRTATSPASSRPSSSTSTAAPPCRRSRRRGRTSAASTAVPTLVNNVETLAHIALIARHGDRWFRSAGVPGAAGTMLVTVDGAVARPGVYEVELGTPIGAVLMSAGGLTERPQAILTGGYFGTWLPVDLAWQLPLTHRDLKAAGGALGAGIIIALPDTSCGLAETARVVRYLAGETAGQCGPCVFGLPALADALADLAYQGQRRADPADWRADRARRRPRCLQASRRRHPARPQRPGRVRRRRSLASRARPVLRHPSRAHPARSRRPGGLVSEILRVNPIACTGHGVCAELLPELIELDPVGLPDRAARRTDDDELPLARRAVASCPALALMLQKTSA